MKTHEKYLDATVGSVLPGVGGAVILALVTEAPYWASIAVFIVIFDILFSIRMWVLNDAEKAAKKVPTIH